MKKIPLSSIIILSSLSLFAQTPFVCDGSFYLALANNANSTIYEVNANTAGNIVFNPLGTGNAGIAVNGIGYRKTDNSIYGVNSNNGDIYRIDAQGQGTFLVNKNQLAQYFIIAGDVSPNGNTLVLIGVINNADNVILEVDLTSASYNITSTPLSSLATGTPTSRSADIAIDSTTGTAILTLEFFIRINCHVL